MLAACFRAAGREADTIQISRGIADRLGKTGRMDYSFRMEIPESIVKNGREQALTSLGRIEVEAVCFRSGATYDPEHQVFTLQSFGQPVHIARNDGRIESPTTVGQLLTTELAELFTLSVLWYLCQAKDAACSGRLLHPNELPGGDMFGKGTHVLPLDALADRFGQAPQNLVHTASTIAAEPQELGDAAVRLWPFPRLPVVILLWGADEEFPARASLLLDSTAHLHLPVDILWATSMVSLLLLLRLK